MTNKKARSSRLRTQRPPTSDGVNPFDNEVGGFRLSAVSVHDVGPLEFARYYAHADGNREVGWRDLVEHL